MATSSSSRAVPHLYRRTIDSIVFQVGKNSLYSLEESSPEWRNYMLNLPPTERHTATVLRRVGSKIALARRRRYCLYCWYPDAICACVGSSSEAASSSTAVACESSGGDDAARWTPKCESELIRRVPILRGRSHGDDQGHSSFSCYPVFIVHPDEFLRSSNTGHIAAMVLDAPLLVDGLPGHREILQEFGQVHPEAWRFEGPPRPEEEVGLQVASAAKLQASSSVQGYLLYPEENCRLLQTVISQNQQRVEVVDAAKRTHESATAGNSSDASKPDEEAEKSTEKADDVMVLGLLDSTWGQAHRLNRSMPKRVERVGLDVSEIQEAKFGALRKRTRETGISTLEATSMALEQLFGAVASSGSQGDAVAATAVEAAVLNAARVSAIHNALHSAMHNHVDLNLVMRGRDVEFGNSEDEVLQATKKRNEQHKGMRKREIDEQKFEEKLAAQRRLRTGEREPNFDDADDDQCSEELCMKTYMTAEELRAILPLAPVARYCPLCEMLVGSALRMVQHCTGKGHQDKIAAVKGRARQHGFPEK